MHEMKNVKISVRQYELVERIIKGSGGAFTDVYLSVDEFVRHAICDKISKCVKFVGEDEDDDDDD